MGADRDGSYGPCTSPAVAAVRFGRAARFAFCGLTLMLTNCAVGPDFQAPALPTLKGFLPGGRESVPGTTVVRGADISARWWEVFHSRQLNRLIQDGIDNNPDLQAAKAGEGGR